QTHGHGRELPEVGHQPGVGIGGQTLAVDFATEVVHLLFGQFAEQEGACIGAGRRVALDIDEVAGAVAAAAPEVVEADIVERGGGSEDGDVAAQTRVVAVGCQHHGHRVPADVGADAFFDRIVAGGGNLLVDGDGVDVIGGGVERHVHAGVAAMLDQAFEQIMSAFGANFGDDAFQRL